MSQMIESMESRMLLTASVAVIRQDLFTLGAAAITAKAEVTADLATAKADVKMVKADVKAADPTKAQKAVLNTFVKDESKIVANFKTKNNKIISSGTSAGASLVSALKSFRKTSHRPRRSEGCQSTPEARKRLLGSGPGRDTDLHHHRLWNP